MERVEGEPLQPRKPQTVANWLEDFWALTEAFPDDFLADRDQPNIAQHRDLYDGDA